MIRPATHADIHVMLALGEKMHGESRYARHRWNVAKVGALITTLIESEDGLALVAETRGEIVGGFLGVVNEHYFTDAKVAADFALFVDPGRRGGIAASLLLAEYIAWARSRGASMIQFGATTGVNHEASARLCKHVGMGQVGELFEIGGI